MTHSFISLENSFQNDIFGQSRTRRHNQYVILKQDFVYKGPYSSDRLEVLISRSEWFQKWKTPLMVLPMETIQTNDGIFVKYENLVSNHFQTEDEIDTFWNTESFTGNRYRVINRINLVKFNQGLPKESWVYQEHGFSILLALVQMWILNVGDTGIYNMLMKISTHQVYIIDFDETSPKNRDNETFYFSKPPGRKFNWYQNMKPFYLPVANQIKQMMNDSYNQPHFDKIQRAIQLLIFHGEGSDIPSIPSRILVPEGTTDESAKLQEQSTAQLIISLDEGKIIDLGEMVWKGLFNGTKTYHGYDLDIMKSAVQKGIRRGMIELSLYSAFELWRLAEIGGTAAQTNLYNRLATIAAEDVGPANLPLVLYVINYVLMDVKNNRDRSPAKLAILVQHLVLSPKTRLMSHIWRAYTNQTARSIMMQKGESMDQTIDENLIGKTEIDGFFRPGDDLRLIPFAKMFYLRMKEKDMNAVWWVYLFLEKVKKDKIAKVARRKRRTKPMIIIWELLRYFLDSTLVDVLSQAYFTFSEGRAFLMMAITCHLYSQDQTESWHKIDDIIQEGISIWEESPYLNKLLRSDYRLEVPEYVIDIHTKAGKINGKNRQDFVKEGALVVNQDKYYYQAELEEIYCQS